MDISVFIRGIFFIKFVHSNLSNPFSIPLNCFYETPGLNGVLAVIFRMHSDYNCICMEKPNDETIYKDLMWSHFSVWDHET
ncbi:unnamed protein product [Heterobilharzia americana]|nr:unnamed protein product [Heterobilharzia americana]